MGFDRRLADHWRSFWNDRFAQVPFTDEDLMQQSANTVNKISLPLEKIRQWARNIATVLELSTTDELVDFCCGNGLLDFELAPHVKSIIGIDFAENMITAAQRLKQRTNIRYRLGDVTAPLSLLIGAEVPNKFLMVGSLGYLQPRELDMILENIVRHMQGRGFRLLMAAAPNQALKASFYDTPERLARHLENERTRPDTNDGMGRWWRAEEIERISCRHGLAVQFTDVSIDGSDYRMDALIRSQAE